MIKLLKILGIIALLLAVSSPIMLGFMSYNLQLRAIKKKVKKELIFNTPKDELVSFSFDLTSSEFKSLRWVHSQEFELDKKMFDIVEADTIGNIVNYLCFPDRQETALNFKFKKMLDERYADNVPFKNNQKLISIFIKSLFVPENSFNEIHFFVELDKNYLAFLEKKESVFLENNTPPPEFIVNI